MHKCQCSNPQPQVFDYPISLYSFESLGWSMFQDSYQSKWAQSRQACSPIVHNITTLKPCYNHITPLGIRDSMVLRICDHICVQSHPVQTITKDAAIFKDFKVALWRQNQTLICFIYCLFGQIAQSQLVVYTPSSLRSMQSMHEIGVACAKETKGQK